MSKIYSIQISADLTYEDNADFTIARGPYSHQVTVETDEVPADGNLTVHIKYTGTSTFEIPVDDAGDELVIDMTNPKTFLINGWIEALQFVPTDFDTDRTYSVTVVSGDQ